MELLQVCHLSLVPSRLGKAEHGRGLPCSEPWSLRPTSEPDDQVPAI